MRFASRPGVTVVLVSGLTAGAAHLAEFFFASRSCTREFLNWHRQGQQSWYESSIASRNLDLGLLGSSCTVDLVDPSGVTRLELADPQYAWAAVFVLLAVALVLITARSGGTNSRLASGRGWALWVVLGVVFLAVVPAQRVLQDGACRSSLTQAQLYGAPSASLFGTKCRVEGLTVGSSGGDDGYSYTTDIAALATGALLSGGGLFRRFKHRTRQVARESAESRR